MLNFMRLATSVWLVVVTLSPIALDTKAIAISIILAAWLIDRALEKRT